MNNSSPLAMRRSVISMLLIQTLLFGQPEPRPFKLLQEWTRNERQWRVIVMPRSSSGQIIETARFIHRKYPQLRFYLVDTERGIAPFNSSVRDPEGNNSPLEWALKHYLGSVSEIVRSGGRGRR